MNLYLRLLVVVLTAFRREKITVDHLVNEIQTLVLPNDLDLNFHVNNGRYLTLCDFNRVDLFVRSGLAKHMVRNGWVPIVAEHSMKYIKPLSVFNRIRITMEITHWDDKYFYSKHVFYRKGVKVAEGDSKSLVISRKDGRLKPSFIVDYVSERQ